MILLQKLPGKQAGLSSGCLDPELGCLSLSVGTAYADGAFRQLLQRVPVTSAAGRNFTIAKVQMWKAPFIMAADLAGI